MLTRPGGELPASGNAVGCGWALAAAAAVVPSPVRSGTPLASAPASPARAGAPASDVAGDGPPADEALPKLMDGTAVTRRPAMPRVVRPTASGLVRESRELPIAPSSRRHGERSRAALPA